MNIITIPRWWFQIFFIFTLIWGRFLFWLIFFKWVGSTTNQIHIKPINSKGMFGARWFGIPWDAHPVIPGELTKHVFVFKRFLKNLPWRTRWWFQICFILFSTLLGEIIQIDWYFSDGLKPPPREGLWVFSVFVEQLFQLFSPETWGQ